MRSSLPLPLTAVLFFYGSVCSPSAGSEEGPSLKTQFEHEVLGFLGMPKPSVCHDTLGSAPRFLLGIYQSIANGTVRWRDSDFAVSFVNQIDHHLPYRRHEKGVRFFFNMGEVSAEEHFVKAELRIYRDAIRCRRKHRGNRIFTLSVYALSDNDTSDRKLKPVEEINITDEVGWLELNVTKPVMSWLEFPKKNRGLYLKITNSHSRNVSPRAMGIVGSNGPLEFQPFMVAFFNKPTNNKPLVRKRRAARALDSYHSSNSCKKKYFYVSFEDLGWKDWVVAPEGYGSFYCYGECNFPLSESYTNHAIVQALVHLSQPSVMPKPCCSPTQLSAITVLHFDNNSNVVLKKFKNMAVKSCGCH